MAYLGETPLVSVVIPTFNRADTLRVALDSALSQTYTNIEVIVSDDGSTDRTEELVASYDDPRVRYRRNHGNLGQTLNNRAGFLAAQGKYIANLHDDDWWTPEFLSKLIPPLEASDDVSVAFCDHWVTDSDGTLRHDWTSHNSSHFKRDTLEKGIHRPFYRLAVLDLTLPTVMGAVMRKSVLDLQDFPEEVDPIYDLWLSYLLCREGHGAYYCPERLTHYRVHGDQESSRRTVKKTAAHIYCYKRFVNDGYLRSIKSDLEARLSKHKIQLAIEWLCDGKTRQARTELLGCLLSSPRDSIPPFILSLLPSHKAKYIATEAKKTKKSRWSVLRGAITA